MFNSILHPTFKEYDFRPVLFILFVMIIVIILLATRNYNALTAKNDWEERVPNNEFRNSFRAVRLWFRLLTNKRTRQTQKVGWLDQLE